MKKEHDDDVVVVSVTFLRFENRLLYSLPSPSSFSLLFLSSSFPASTSSLFVDFVLCFDSVKAGVGLFSHFCLSSFLSLPFVVIAFSFLFHNQCMHV